MRFILFISFFSLTTLSCNDKPAVRQTDDLYSPGVGSSHSPAVQGEDVQNDGSNYPDGTYCAEVEYDNPRTGSNSSYTLTVEVESNEITQVNFPNGGWMDSDHFDGAELERDGTATFTSDKGYDYQITITGRGRNCFTDSVPVAEQCSGETTDGDQCENTTDNSNGLCWRHQDQE